MEKFNQEPSPLACRVGVKFCGGCNPQIPVGDLFCRIQEEAAEKTPALQFGPADQPESAALLVISGCPRDCAERPEVNAPEVSVAGELFERESCPLAFIPAAAVDKLLFLVQQLPEDDPGRPTR